MATIAVIGLGKMGSGIAGRLIAAGHQLNLYNRTPAKAAALVRVGARLCASPAEAGRNADAVISMVSDDVASRDVWLGADGILTAAETMAFAERAGLDLRVVADAIATGQAASPQVVRNTQRMVLDDHDRNITFTPRLRLKDVDYALQLAGSLGLGTPFGALAARAFGELCDTGHADENESNVIAVARTRSP